MTFKEYINNNNITPDVTELYLYYKGLIDINGIEEFTNLEYLDLTNNNISDISNIANLTSLKYLYLFNNNLPNLPSNINNIMKYVIEQWYSKF